MIAQSIVAAAGDTIEFDWNLLSFEGSSAVVNDDFVFLSISAIGESSLGSVLTTALIGTTNPAWSQSGWMTASYVVPSAGGYLVAIGVFDAGNTQDASALLLDRFTLIPEPDTAMLVWLGLAGLAWGGGKRSGRKRDACSEPRAPPLRQI